MPPVAERPRLAHQAVDHVAILDPRLAPAGEPPAADEEQVDRQAIGLAPEAEHVALQARVLATAAEAIRIITALVYPILPDAAAKVWLQLGQGEIADSAKNAFLTQINWGGLRAGTHFAEPAPLFPRAEKDAVARMQQIEEQNSLSVIEAAGGKAVSAIEPIAANEPVLANKPAAAAPEGRHENSPGRQPWV